MNDDFSHNTGERQQKQASREDEKDHESSEHQCTSSQLTERCESENKNSDRNKRKRSKHKCPYPQCKSSVIHLPRHMRKSHGWSPEKSQSVLNTFGLRKLKNKKVRKTKRTYKSVVCPISKCQAVIKRIHNHLTTVHKIKSGTNIYKKCL